MPEANYPVINGEIASLADYSALIKKIQAEWKDQGVDYFPANLWFRGQKNDWPLLPKVLRPVEDPETDCITTYNELMILEAFTALYRNYIAERFEDRSLEMLAFMQHYGAPTRLLDWTENALIGLYFAVEAVRPDSAGSPVVWIMCPGQLNTLALEGDRQMPGPFLGSIAMVRARIEMIGRLREIRPGMRFKIASGEEVLGRYLTLPFAFYPVSSGNLRLATQKGCFTIHGTQREAIEDLFTQKGKECFLRRVCIRKEAAGAIREELRVMGITPRSVFPDLAGLVQELSGRTYFDWSQKKP